MKKIAKIIIEGTIQKENATYNQKWLLETIKNLTERKDFAGIFLYINSPGGGVYESDEVYEAILKYKEKTQKKVYAYLADVAASGGYYIACSADIIMANRNCLTGSIGVIAAQFLDVSKFLKKYEIRASVVHSGKNKVMGNPLEPFTQEQVKIMQSVSDECYEQFTKLVAKSRHLEIEEVKSLADGRVYTARQAVENGLIDEVSSFDDAVKSFCRDVLNDEESEPNIKEFKPKEKRNFMKMLKGASSQMGKIEEFSQILQELGLKTKIPFPAYYCEFCSKN